MANGHDKVLAWAINLLVGWAAYEKATAMYPLKGCSEAPKFL